jgi:hypothetical protein
MKYADIVSGAEDITEDYNGRGPLVVGGVPHTEEHDRTKARQMPLGFPTTAMTAGLSLNVAATTQVLFRGRRLVIPSDIAASILVNDLRIGKNSQFPSTGPVPGRVFSEAAVGVDLSLDTAQISQSIVLNVTNTSVGAITFNAALLGDSLE